jgi:hypothetical protein
MVYTAMITTSAVTIPNNDWPPAQVCELLWNLNIE